MNRFLIQWWAFLLALFTVTVITFDLSYWWFALMIVLMDRDIDDE